MAEHTKAQKIGSLHAKLLAMADQFEALLADLVRDDQDAVGDSLLLQGADGSGVRLTITAVRLEPHEVAAAVAQISRGARA
jgi:hypothetical protein